MKRVLFVSIMLLAAAATVFAAGGQEATKGDIIKFGVFEPLTGANAAGGAEELDGIRLAQDLYPTVTVGGKEYKIELVVADNKSDKVEAANAGQRLVDGDKVTLVLGSWGSSLSMAAGPIFEAAKIPAIGLSCTNPLVTLGNDFYFRVCFLDPFQGTVMANYAVKDVKAKNAVIIREVTNDYSVGLAKFFADAFKSLTGNSGSILAELNYQTGDQDFSAQLTRVKSLNPDVIFAPGNYTESALIIKQARELGITAPFLGGDTWEIAEFVNVGRQAVEGAVMSAFFDNDAPLTPLSKVFVAEYQKKYGKLPSGTAVLGFDGYLLAIDAIKRANSTDPIKIRDAIAVTKGFAGAAGVVNLDQNGDPIKSAVIKEVKNGKFVYKTTVAP
ncbi:MAG: branched-chain amino acid ABC transporter substrate-binding protein [Spirochaetes bacterium RIFOXYC1_FULL_54_7]|nr:MAG: branched-chain amino acid ABC transporter substrate-binding protein [Spirochaetes bacterium RIFOXYC1_FULL_54_7]